MTNSTVKAVLASVLVLMAGFVGANVVDSVGLETNQEVHSVDTNTEWNDGTLTNGLEVVDGYLQLNSSTASKQTYTSQSQDYNETDLSYLKVYTEDVSENTTVTSTVTVYDGTGTAVDSKTFTVSETSSYDISSLGNLSSGASYDVELTLNRDATSTTTPKVDAYTVSASQQSPLGTLGVVILILAAIAAAVSRMN